MKTTFVEGRFFSSKEQSHPQLTSQQSVPHTSSKLNSSCPIAFRSESQEQKLQNSNIECESIVRTSEFPNGKQLKEKEENRLQDKYPFDRILQEIEISVSQNKEQILKMNIDKKHHSNEYSINQQRMQRNKSERIDSALALDGNDNINDNDNLCKNKIKKQREIPYKPKPHLLSNENIILEEINDSQYSFSSDQSNKEDYYSINKINERKMVDSNKEVYYYQNNSKESITNLEQKSSSSNLQGRGNGNLIKENNSLNLSMKEVGIPQKQSKKDESELQQQKHNIQEERKIKNLELEVEKERILPQEHESQYSEKSSQSTVVRKNYQNLIQNFKSRSLAPLSNETNNFNSLLKDQVFHQIIKKLREENSEGEEDFYIVKKLLYFDETSKNLSCQQNETYYLEETGEDFIFASSNPEGGERIERQINVPISTGTCKMLSKLLTEAVYSGQESNRIYLVNTCSEKHNSQQITQKNQPEIVQEELESLKKEISYLLTQLQDASSEIQNQSEVILDQSNTIEKLDYQLNQLREDLKQKSSQIDIKDSQINSLFQERDSTKKKKKELKMLLREEQEQTDQLKIEIYQIGQELQQSQKELQICQQQTKSQEGIEEKQRFFNQQSEYFQQQLDQFSEENSLHKQEVISLQHIIIRLQQQNKAMQQERSYEVNNTSQRILPQTENHDRDLSLVIKNNNINGNRLRSQSYNECPHQGKQFIDKNQLPSNNNNSNSIFNNQSLSINSSSFEHYNSQDIRRSIQQLSQEIGRKSISQLRKSVDSHQNYSTTDSIKTSQQQNQNVKDQSVNESTLQVNRLSPIPSNSRNQYNSQISCRDSSVVSSGISHNKSQNSTTYHSRNGDSVTTRLSNNTPNSNSQLVKNNSFKSVPMSQIEEFSEYPLHQKEITGQQQSINQVQRIRSQSNAETTKQNGSFLKDNSINSTFQSKNNQPLQSIAWSIDINDCHENQQSKENLSSNGDIKCMQKIEVKRDHQTKNYYQSQNSNKSGQQINKIPNSNNKMQYNYTFFNNDSEKPHQQISKGTSYPQPMSSNQLEQEKNQIQNQPITQLSYPMKQTEIRQHTSKSFHSENVDNFQLQNKEQNNFNNKHLQNNNIHFKQTQSSTFNQNSTHNARTETGCSITSDQFFAQGMQRRPPRIQHPELQQINGDFSQQIFKKQY